MRTDESDRRLALLHENVRKHGTVYNTVAPGSELSGVLIRESGRRRWKTREVAMRTWLKRMRGAVGMGLTWAVSWSAIGALVAVLPWTVPAGFPIRLEWIVGFAAQFAVLGFVGGAAFSVVLGVIERRRRFDQLSLSRFAVWGAFGGLMMWAARGTVGWSVMDLLGSVGVQGLNWAYAVSGGVIVLLGAGSAAGSLALARSVDDQELLEAGEDVAEVGLTAKEMRELLSAPTVHRHRQ